MANILETDPVASLLEASLLDAGFPEEGLVDASLLEARLFDASLFETCLPEGPRSVCMEQPLFHTYGTSRCSRCGRP